MVSVNSSSTAMREVKMGFQNSCYLKSDCDLAIGEVCLFKVYNNTRYTADSTHIADCNTPNFPFTNSFGAQVCCMSQEVCGDGIDNDKDGFIDCADNECNTWTSANPVFCTGSPYNSSGCVMSYTQNPVTFAIAVTYNPLCRDQPPIGINEYYYCGYEKLANPALSQGLCCPPAKYPKFDALNGWRCVDTAICGINKPGDECNFDFDANKVQWLGSAYSPSSPAKWCQSKFPNFFTPDNYVPYAPRRSTGCCLINSDGTIDYFTAENNVKIFGCSS